MECAVRSPEVALLRFEALDGLRGLAAVFVVLYHYVLPSHHAVVFGHGYLAVDFFFVLSGFVVCHAYEQKLRNGMTWFTFALRRVIRLYPLVIISGLLAGLLAVLQHALWTIEMPRWSSIILATFLLPDLRGGTGDLFPVNSPLWSLFFEMVVNLLYAACATRLTDRGLAAWTTGCVFAVVACAWHANTLNLGSTGATMIPGIFRTAAAFGIGILIGRLHRSGRLRSPHISIIALGALLALAFALPSWESFNWAFDVAAAYVLFPIAVIAGISVRSEGNARGLIHLAGDLSYPLYLVHFPLRTAIQAFVSHLPLSEWGAICSEIIIAVAASWVVLQAFDRPLRVYLAKRFAARAAKMPAH